MNKVEVSSKNSRGTIEYLEDGSFFLTVEDKRVNRDYEAIIERIKEDIKSGDSNTQKLLNQALVQTMVEMRRFECYLPKEEASQKDQMQKEVEKVTAKDLTETYLSKKTLEKLFYDTAYDCLKDYGEKNREEQITLYTEQIHAFLSFLLKKKPCKEIDLEISKEDVDEIIRPMATGKIPSDVFPYFLLFCVIIVLLPESYILSMFDNASRREKRKKVIMAKAEIAHLYDYEYVLNKGYVVDRVTKLRGDLFELYQSTISYFGSFVEVELINQKNTYKEQELTYQLLEKVSFKNKDVALDGYIYLYESFMESEHYWAKNNFNSMLEILKGYVENIEDLVEKEHSYDSSGKKKVVVPGERNRTKVDKYRVEILQRMLDYYEMEGETFFKTKTNEYIRKSILIVLDVLTKDQISGKNFPVSIKKVFDNKQQGKEYTTAMKFVDCMLVYLVGCYEQELEPDIFARYCDAMTMRYISANIQSAGCDEIELLINDLVPYYKKYEQEFRIKAYGKIRELIWDKDVVSMVSAGIIEYVWEHMQRGYDGSLFVKDAFSEGEVGALVTEKDFIRLSKKLRKSESERGKLI